MRLEGRVRDDGDAEHGDLLRGDGLWSFRQRYTAQSVEPLRFRISYQQDGRELKSKVLQLGFYEHLTGVQINHILSTQQTAAQTYSALSLSVGEERTRDAALEELSHNPTVIRAGISANGRTISVLYAPGVIIQPEMIEGFLHQHFDIELCGFRLLVNSVAMRLRVMHLFRK